MSKSTEGFETMAHPRIEVRRNCTLVYSALTSDMFRAISGDLPAGSILDRHLARLTGAQFAMGLPADLAKLTRAMEPVSRRRVDEAFPDQPEHVREWLAVGRHTLSSQILFSRLIGITPPGAITDGFLSYPYDANDFARCREMLDAIPEAAANLHLAADLSSEWGVLIERWDSICAAMDEEAPDWAESCHRASMARHMIEAALRDAKHPVRVMP